jgi:uncharacterized protein YbbK (DUF523 family)
MKLCSACLLGVRCRYDGQKKPVQRLIDLAKREKIIPICPEHMGGLPTPRPGAEIRRGEGKDVLEGKARVFDYDGNDVTEQFKRGALRALKVAWLFGTKEAILKQRSSSCGSGQIYDGTFSGRVVRGDGVTAALLKKHGIKVITEEDVY